MEQLLTYFINGEEYPFLGKDQLELALPGLKKNHLRYDEVAGRNIRYLFGNQLDDARVLHVDTLASLCLLNTGHGGFTAQPLPTELQLSPIFSFLPLDTSHPSAAAPPPNVAAYPNPAPRQYLALGNFYGVQPYEGRYDAANPTIFTFDGKFHVTGPLTQQAGEWRDAKLVRGLGHFTIVLARNNDFLLRLPLPVRTSTPQPKHR